MEMRNNGLWKSIVMASLCALSLVAAANEKRDLDFAIEKAAEQTVVKLNANNLTGIDSIAFI